jgi:hypothetical protein
MSPERLGLFAFVTATIGAFLVGCSQPNPNTPAGRSDVTGQQSAVCMATNPGDYYACHAICVRRVEDETAYLKAIGR